MKIHCSMDKSRSTLLFVCTLANNTFEVFLGKFASSVLVYLLQCLWELLHFTNELAVFFLRDFCSMDKERFNFLVHCKQHIVRFFSKPLFLQYCNVLSLALNGQKWRVTTAVQSNLLASNIDYLLSCNSWTQQFLGFLPFVAILRQFCSV